MDWEKVAATGKVADLANALQDVEDGEGTANGVTRVVVAGSGNGFQAKKDFFDRGGESQNQPDEGQGRGWPRSRSDLQQRKPAKRTGSAVTDLDDPVVTVQPGFQPPWQASAQQQRKQPAKKRVGFTVDTDTLHQPALAKAPPPFPKETTRTGMRGVKFTQTGLPEIAAAEEVPPAPNDQLRRNVTVRRTHQRTRTMTEFHLDREDQADGEDEAPQAPTGNQGEATARRGHRRTATAYSIQLEGQEEPSRSGTMTGALKLGQVHTSQPLPPSILRAAAQTLDLHKGPPLRALLRLDGLMMTSVSAAINCLGVLRSGEDEGTMFDACLSQFQAILPDLEVQGRDPVDLLFRIAQEQAKQPASESWYEQLYHLSLVQGPLGEPTTMNIFARMSASLDVLKQCKTFAEGLPFERRMSFEIAIDSICRLTDELWMNFVRSEREHWGRSLPSRSAGALAHEGVESSAMAAGRFVANQETAAEVAKEGITSGAFLAGAAGLLCLDVSTLIGQSVAQNRGRNIDRPGGYLDVGRSQTLGRHATCRGSTTDNLVQGRSWMRTPDAFQSGTPRAVAEALETASRLLDRKRAALMGLVAEDITDEERERRLAAKAIWISTQSVAVIVTEGPFDQLPEVAVISGIARRFKAVVDSADDLLRVLIEGDVQALMRLRASAPDDYPSPTGVDLRDEALPLFQAITEAAADKKDGCGARWLVENGIASAATLNIPRAHALGEIEGCFARVEEVLKKLVFANLSGEPPNPKLNEERYYEIYHTLTQAIGVFEGDFEDAIFRISSLSSYTSSGVYEAGAFFATKALSGGAALLAARAFGLGDEKLSAVQLAAVFGGMAGAVLAAQLARTAIGLVAYGAGRGVHQKQLQKWDQGSSSTDDPVTVVPASDLGDLTADLVYDDYFPQPEQPEGEQEDPPQ